MTPQENIQFIKDMIQADREEVEVAMENGYEDSDYIQYVNDKIEALSDMLGVYEEYWEV